MITYRKAVLEDLPGVYALMCQLEEQALPYGPFTAIYGRLAENPAHTFFLSEEGDTLLGMLHLRVEGQLHHAGLVAEIVELSVSSSCRGRGLGKALVGMAKQEARAQGCMVLEVPSGAHRGRAHRFYEREGFSRTHYRFSMPLDTQEQE